MSKAIGQQFSETLEKARLFDLIESSKLMINCSSRGVFVADESGLRIKAETLLEAVKAISICNAQR